MECIIDGHNGIYVPQIFAQRYAAANENRLSMQDDFAILKLGPDNDEYWETWDDMLNKFTLIENGKTYRLYESNGDLFLIEDGEEIPED